MATNTRRIRLAAAAWALSALVACSAPDGAAPAPSSVGAAPAAWIVTVRFKSSLSADEIRRRYPRRMPDFRALPGLVQKYYVYDPQTGDWGGIYLWDSEASARAYLDSDLRRSIPDA